MTEDKKLFARLDWDDYRNDGDCSKTVEVKDLADAAKQGTTQGADFFTTHTVATVTVGGKTFSGDTEQNAGRHYLKQEKLYTPAEVIAKLQQDAAKAAPVTAKLLADMRKHGMGAMADDIAADFAAAGAKEDPKITAAKSEPATTRYAKLRWKGLVKLQDGETAWDSKGRQLWPADTAPAAAKIKPSSEFDL